jgi:hypothetical protein
MSAPASSFTPQVPAHVFVTSGEKRKIKTNHQHLAHVINRMTGRMGFPDKAARCVVGLHGLLNGRETHSFPALIAHKYAARQFNYIGKEENSDVFMGRFLDALKDAEIKAGRKCFEIERANGVTTIITTYHHDYIGEAALWALTEAQAFDAWKANPAKAVTDELIDRAIALLPERTAPAPRETSDGSSITDDSIAKGMWTKSDTFAEAAMRTVAKAGGDPLAALEEAHRRQRRIAVEVRREQLERDRAAKDAEDYATVDWLADTKPDTDGKNISDNLRKFSTAADHLSDTDHPTDCRMPSPQTPENQQVNFEPDENTDSLHTTCALASEAEGDQPKLRAALRSVAEGIPVLALWGVADAICDCPQGSECGSPGKHPYPRFSPNGVHSATSDAAKLRMWYAKDPRINFGQQMGGAQNIICVDVDPRNDGDATYHDLLKAHGDDAFPETREKTTGGGGWHKLYRLSKPITGNGELNAKLGPGIDVKGAGGLIVAPFGDHASGRTYGSDNGEEIALAPAWIEDRIIKAASGERPKPEPVKFQADRGSRETLRAFSSGFIPGGTRNRKMFEIGCAVWGQAKASDVFDLYEQLMEVFPRCEVLPLDPFTADDVLKIAHSIMRYPRGVPIQSEVAT